MAKQKIKNGDIIEIPLPKNLGFSYGKYVDLIEIDRNNRYPCLIRIYNLRTKTRLDNIVKLKNVDLLFSPLLVGGVPPIVSKGDWKVIGNQNVAENEIIIPCFKVNESDVMTDDSNVKVWYYAADADISKKVKTNYNMVRHLETLGAIGSELLSIKIAMGFLKSEGKKISRYFELQTFTEKVFYNQVVNTTPYYELEESQRGKVEG